MQSTGHSSTHPLSFTSMQGSAIVYVIPLTPFPPCRPCQWESSAGRRSGNAGRQEAEGPDRRRGAFPRREDWIDDRKVGSGRAVGVQAVPSSTGIASEADRLDDL